METYGRSQIAAKQARRRFLKGMGLGAVSAPLILGIGDSLIGRALGQTNRRKLALFFVHGESWLREVSVGGYTPPGVKELALVGSKLPADGQDEDRVGVQWPEFVAALAPWKDRMVLVDGLPMLGVTTGSSTTIHGFKMGVLSAVGNMEVPTAPSIDAHVAAVLSRDTPVKSLLFGMHGGPKGDEFTETFVAAAGAKAKHALNPNTLLSRMVGVRPGPAGAPGAPPTTVLGTRLLDVVRSDLARLDRGLAAEEKALLTEYLTSMEAYQKKEKALADLATTGGGAGCAIPSTPPTGMGMPGVAAMDSMFRLSTLALKCNVTNVIGATMGNTDAHGDLDPLIAGYAPHSSYATQYRAFVPTSMGWVARMMTELGPALVDSLTVTIVPAGGIAAYGTNIHHGNATLAAFVFDGPRALKTGARFLRGSKRHIADLYTTLATALGAPVDKFNGAGMGKINELLA